MGRIYLPQEAMEKFGVELRLILNEYSTAFHNLAAEMPCARGNIFKHCLLLFAGIGVP